MKRLLVLALIVAGCGSTATGPAQPAPATPTPTTVPAAVATTTPAPVPVTSGTGKISFGKGLNNDTLEVTGAATQFKRTIAKIAWSASLIEPAGATSLTFILASRSSSGSERVILKENIDVSDPSFDEVANKVDLASIVGRKPGTYVMRYLHGAKVLAQGTFKLVK